ncbi:PREDICTED: uncharacterized protein LOC107337582 [Acropora digitifera]|uniref:uncharacterized protein LOC107337582 n=1 Tax=Acropora digitifera TaxID=70779 RepID=UPI00077A814A|nr:PREDICTED: uncharacterized protein LOC107337582 [Acropora digitifera]
MIKLEDVQLANQFQQQGTNLSASFLSPSECVAWVTIFGFESVCIVALNTITIIVYLKEHSLRKRSMYLVINLEVADMLVASCAVFWCCDLGVYCRFWTTNFFEPQISHSYDCSVALISVIIGNKPCYHFTGADARYVSSIQASPHKEENFWSSYCGSWICFNYFLFCLLIILVSYSSIAIRVVCGNQPHRHSATTRERKLTKTLFIVTVVSLLLARFQLNYPFYFLLYANSLVNPILYAFRMPQFRKSLFSFLCCKL